jgi:hypothetical protein
MDNNAYAYSGYSYPAQKGSPSGQNAFGGSSQYPETESADNRTPGEAYNAQASSSSRYESYSEDSPEDANASAQAAPSLDQLKRRGKGTYTCPHGKDCTRGGVQPSGELVVFTRNSAFR